MYMSRKSATALAIGYFAPVALISGWALVRAAKRGSKAGMLAALVGLGLGTVAGTCAYIAEITGSEKVGNIVPVIFVAGLFTGAIAGSI